MRFVALRRLKIGDGYREPGQPVPEAMGWRNRHVYVERGLLAVVAGDEPDAPAVDPRLPNVADPLATKVLRRVASSASPESPQASPASPGGAKTRAAS